MLSADTERYGNDGCQWCGGPADQATELVAVIEKCTFGSSGVGIGQQFGETAQNNLTPTYRYEIYSGK